MNEEVQKVSRKGAPKGHPQYGHKPKLDDDVKMNYNCSFRVNREEFKKFQEVCNQNGTKYAKVLKSFMRDYIRDYSKSFQGVSEEK